MFPNNAIAVFPFLVQSKLKHPSGIDSNFDKWIFYARFDEEFNNNRLTRHN